jgi:hypothetical protein
MEDVIPTGRSKVDQRYISGSHIDQDILQIWVTVNNGLSDIERLAQYVGQNMQGIR